MEANLKELLEAIRVGNFAKAVRIYRLLTGASFKDAKEVIYPLCGK